MKKSIALCVLTVFLVPALFSQTMPTRPAWIDALHDFDSADVVYFVGKSAQGGSENYLEAKGSAVADVLTQFAFYKEVKISSMEQYFGSEGEENHENSSSFYESTSLIEGKNIDTGGLYQCEEYEDPQGTVFVRFGYRKNSPVFERFRDIPKEISEYWVPSKDKVYFLSTVWSASRNAQELRALAKEDAALQASLWLGSSLSFRQAQYLKTKEKNGFGETDLESLEIAMECIGSYQTLQEEGYTIGARTNPGAFSCIALYSIKRNAAVSTPEIKEGQRFTFSIQAGGGQGDFSGVKSVTFTDTEHGYHEYSGEIQEKGAPQKQGQMPEWVRTPSQYADALIGIGVGTNDWNSEVQKYQAQGNALTNLSYHIAALRNEVMADYAKRSEANSSDDTLTDYAFKVITLARHTLSGLKKVREAQAGGTNYQMWQVPQEVVDKALKEAEIGR